MSTALSTEEISAWIRLSLEPGLGPATARKLLAAVGLPQDIYNLSAASLAKYLPSEIARQLKAAPTSEIQDTITRSLDWLQASDHHLLTLADPAYPRALLDIHDPPLVLYAKGNVALLQGACLAVVGARSATPAGMDNAKAFAKHLAGQGWCIVSGLALGIDTAAHEGALQTGATIAVLATGIDIVYPSRNRALAHQIARDGLLLTEFALGTHAQPWQFPKRNRIVAGLSKGVLVVEAARQSGSLITARMASDMGREVFAIPGSIHSPLARGCHALIRQGAKLVESAQDISDELGVPAGLSRPMKPEPPAAGPQSAGPLANGPLTVGPQATRPESVPVQPLAASNPLLLAMGHDPASADLLHARTGMNIGDVQAQLLQLELNDQIVLLPDGRYQTRQKHPI